MILIVELLIGCSGAPIKPDVDVCNTISANTKTENTVLYDEKDWETYFVGVGARLAYNMKVGIEECVEVNILSATHNQATLRSRAGTA